MNMVNRLAVVVSCAFVLWMLGRCIYTVLDPTVSEGARFFAARSLGDFVFYGSFMGALALVMWVVGRFRRIPWKD